jgi:tetratricopeptide (TPR) repeat protein
MSKPLAENPTTMQPAPRPLSTRRKWGFRLAAALLPLVGLVLLELVLVWSGAGEDLQLVLPAGEGAPADVFRFNRHTDKAYYGPTDLSGPEARPFHIPKPAGTYRIVVIGGSTVEGFPYPSELAFPRFLEILLRIQHTGREIEVLNAGITAINSFGEADLVEQSLSCQPDLIIVYSGHNEFVGPGGVGSTFGGVAPRWSPVLFALRRTRTYQSIEGSLRPPAREKRQLLDELPGDLKIPRDGAKFRRAEDYFRANIERALRVAGRAGVPILLTTPVTNLRHQPPMQSVFREGLPAEALAAWHESFERGERARNAGRFGLALDEFDKALAIDGRHALLMYRRAQCFDGLERWDEARDAYRIACDLDACRFRAPSSFARILEGCSVGAPCGNCHYLDTASIFAGGVPQGIPGNESFLEHVHFTYDGNWRMAAILAEYVARHILDRSWRADLVPGEVERDQLCGVITQDHLTAFSLILMMLERAPLSQTADIDQQVEGTRSTLSRFFAELPPDEREIFADLSLEKMQADLIGALFARYSLSAMEVRAGALLHRAAIREPWRTEFVISLAERELGNGRPAEAMTLLDKAQEWKPDSPRALRLREQLAEH